MLRSIVIAAIGAALAAPAGQANAQAGATVYVFCSADYETNGRRASILSDLAAIPAADFKPNQVESNWKSFLKVNLDIEGATRCHTTPDKAALEQQMKALVRARETAGVATSTNSYPPH